ncbi:MAG: O-antigen ligase family protein [Bacteroidales bacterium]
MANATHKHSNASLKKKPQTPLNLLYLFLLLTYGFVTLLTPNFQSLDSNAPKFLTLALLNLISFISLFSSKELRSKPHWYFAFFKNGIGLAYTGLIIFSLLSFFKAINLLESLLHFTKIFTIFTTSYLVSILITSDRRNVFYLCVALTLVLVFDSLNVFLDLNKYIHGKLSGTNDFKSVYSTKNILTASIFIKIPFALSLMIFEKKWIRIFGISALFMAVISIFFLSTRAFYLGIFSLSIVLILYFIRSFINTHDKQYFKYVYIYLIILILSFLIYSSTQHFLYPKQGNEIYNKSVVSRLTTIKTTESSTAARLEGWQRSWHVFKKEPLLGVGLGNWKIVTLKEENETTEDFSYQQKAHNDFIEITTETGIFGGILFITIFILTLGLFIKLVFRNYTGDWFKLFFLPAFGLFCYSFDALFNFPQDRPEIQILFAIYSGIAIAVYSLYKIELTSLTQNDSNLKTSFFHRLISSSLLLFNKFQFKEIYFNFFKRALILLVFLFLMFSIYILNLNFISLKLQKLISDDLKSNKFTHPASLFLNEFPFIPNLTITATPIAVQKARYLMVENRNEEAISILKNDKSNPFDALSMGLIAEAYNNIKNIDSSLVYTQKMYILKPYNFENISFFCERLHQKGMQNKAASLLDNYLIRTKNNQDAWIFSSAFYFKNGNLQKAVSVIDTAVLYFPADSRILQQKAAIDLKAQLLPYQKIYDAATMAFNNNKFSEACDKYSKLLINLPDFNEARINRAFCYFFLNEYNKSNTDLNFLFSKENKKANLFNLMGVNYNKLRNKEEACKNFKIAAELGDADGINNYSKFCQPKGK